MQKAVQQMHQTRFLYAACRDATEGLVVAGRAATWEATRPKVLPAGESVKHRGFIDYRR